MSARKDAQFAEAIAGQMIAEILQDPVLVACHSWEQLQDHCDANVLGGVGDDGHPVHHPPYVEMAGGVRMTSNQRQVHVLAMAQHHITTFLQECNVGLRECMVLYHDEGDDLQSVNFRAHSADGAFDSFYCNWLSSLDSDDEDNYPDYPEIEATVPAVEAVIMYDEHTQTLNRVNGWAIESRIV